MRRLNLDVDDLVRRYKLGASVKKLAEDCGCARGVVEGRLRERGVVLRGRSEAMCVRMAATPVEERQRIVSKAHDAVRGRVHSEEEKVRRAKTRHELQLGISTYARELQLPLEKLCGRVHLEWPVGRYNLDLALDAFPIAVEIHGGGWHSSGRHAARRTERLEYLRRCGWSIVEVWQIQSGWDPLAVAYQIGAIHKLLGPNPPAIGEHWMLRCDGELAPALRSYGHDIAAVDSASRRDNATGRYRRVP